MGDMDGRGVNPRREKTELAIVWFAANHYYEASYRQGREFGGAVFRRADGSYGVTVRKGEAAAINMKDVHKDMPAGATLTALWHSHVPASALKEFSLDHAVTDALIGYDVFSAADKALIRKLALGMNRKYAYYLVTAEVIKRYAVAPRSNGIDFVEQTQVFRKPPPRRMGRAIGDGSISL